MLLLLHPRRHRRHLPLPPGLLALVWLLWLGCVAVPQVPGIQPQTVLEVNFHPLHPNLNLPHGRDYIYSKDYLIEYSPPATIEAFRPWQTFAITGNLFEDYFALRNAQVVFHHLEVDPNHDRGLQVHLGQQASYSSLVQLLDWCNVYNMKRYWIDIRHEPTTLRVFTTESNFNTKVMLSGCIISSGYPYTPPVLHKPFWVRFDDFTTDFWQFEWLAPLLSSDWRNSVLLLLLLGAVSAYRLGRDWWVR